MVKLSVRRRIRLTSKVRGIPLKASCSEPCTVDGRLTIAAKQAKALHMHTPRAGLTVGHRRASRHTAGSVVLTVPFSTRFIRAAKHARRIDLRLTIVVRDPAGNARTLSAALRLSR